MSMQSKRWVIGGFLLIGCFLAADLTAARFERKAVDSAPPVVPLVPASPVAATPEILKSPRDLQTVLNNTATGSPAPVATVTVTATPGQVPTTTAPAPATSAPPPSAPLPHLVGTVAGSGHSLAVLQLDDITRVCSPGDNFGDYRVMEVSPYSTRLRDAAGQPHILQIGQNTPGTAPLAPAPVVTPVPLPAPTHTPTPFRPVGGTPIEGTPPPLPGGQPPAQPGQMFPSGPGQPAPPAKPSTL